MRSMFLDKLNKHWKEKWNGPNNDIGLYGLFEKYMILNLLSKDSVLSSTPILRKYQYSICHLFVDAVLEIKYFVDHELGRRRTFFSLDHVTKLGDEIKRFGLPDVVFNILITCCQRQINSPAEVRAGYQFGGNFNWHLLRSRDYDFYSLAC